LAREITGSACDWPPAFRDKAVGMLGARGHSSQRFTDTMAARAR
jgi:hypothetical protein